MVDKENMDKLVRKLNDAQEEIKKVIFGQDNVVELTLTTIISGGHVLLMGVPGLAKTLLVSTIGEVLGLSSNRIQCTPDLMPSDITGAEVLEEDTKGKRSFRFIKGPIFTELLMADEINRASPRTQSALLQAMQEKHVTVTGNRYDLPNPFHVLATQNPLEQEGTYPLPEAQLDRFLMQINLGYPDEESEKKVVISTTGNDIYAPKTIITKEELLEIQKIVRDMPIGDDVLNAAIKLVRSARPDIGAASEVNKYVVWAPGPRASQALVLAARAKALLDGRSAPSSDDVIELALPILRHRMALNYKASADGVALDDIVNIISKDI